MDIKHQIKQTNVLVFKILRNLSDRVLFSVVVQTPVTKPTREDVAVIMYTSGSTGIPKGNITLFGIKPNKLGGLSHPYQMGESIFIFRGIRSKNSVLFHFSMKFMKANRIAPDGMQLFLWRHIRVYSVCMCPINRMPGLHKLINLKLT